MVECSHVYTVIVETTDGKKYGVKVEKESQQKC